MKKKIIIIGIGLAIILGVAIYLFKINKTEEYIPEEEISLQDAKKILVPVFFQNRDTKGLEAEMENLDVKDMLLNPYEAIVKRLFLEPENSELEKIVPEELALDSVDFENYIVKIEMSSEKMIEDEEMLKKIKESIEKSLTGLNEVSSVEIKINDVQI